MFHVGPDAERSWWLVLPALVLVAWRKRTVAAALILMLCALPPVARAYELDGWYFDMPHGWRNFDEEGNPSSLRIGSSPSLYWWAPMPHDGEAMMSIGTYLGRGPVTRAFTGARVVAPVRVETLGGRAVYRADISGPTAFPSGQTTINAVEVDERVVVIWLWDNGAPDAQDALEHVVATLHLWWEYDTEWASRQRQAQMREEMRALQQQAEHNNGMVTLEDGSVAKWPFAPPAKGAD